MCVHVRYLRPDKIWTVSRDPAQPKRSCLYLSFIPKVIDCLECVWNFPDRRLTTIFLHNMPLKNRAYKRPMLPMPVARKQSESVLDKKVTQTGNHQPIIPISSVKQSQQSARRQVCRICPRPPHHTSSPLPTRCAPPVASSCWGDLAIFQPSSQAANRCSTLQLHEVCPVCPAPFRPDCRYKVRTR